LRRRGSHLPDNRITDGGEIPDTHVCERLSRPQGHSAIGRVRLTKKKAVSSIIEPTIFQFVATNYSIACPSFGCTHHIDTF
jgi:hypothetical protein